jgi:hypothetical protein
LEGVVSDQIGRHLTAEAHERDRIHVGISQGGNHIGHAGSRRHETHPRLAGGLGVSFGHVAGTLLMASQHHLNVLLLVQHVEDLEDNPPRQREEGFHSFTLEAFDKNFGACQFHADLQSLPGPLSA